ncbi:MAG: hypothetical protein FWC91_08280 [Defluviitaleaceae bacterium]|nr:hypothetical protein [Defluviitaleaceae bacterium]
MQSKKFKIIWSIIILPVIGVAAILLTVNVSHYSNTIYKSFSEMENLEMEPQNLIEMYMMHDKLTGSELHFKLINHTDYLYFYGTAFTLYVRTRDSWNMVNFHTPKGVDEIGFSGIAFPLYPNSYVTEFINLNMYFGNLPPGEYRLIKEVRQHNVPNNDITLVGAFNL